MYKRFLFEQKYTGSSQNHQVKPLPSNDLITSDFNYSR